MGTPGNSDALRYDFASQEVHFQGTVFWIELRVSESFRTLKLRCHKFEVDGALCSS